MSYRVKPSLKSACALIFGLMIGVHGLLASAQENRITGTNLSSSVAQKGSTVRVTITGNGNCTTRLDNGGAETSTGKTTIDLPGAFPKFVSLVVNAGPGSYTVSARSASQREAPCVGEATAILVVNDRPAGATAPKAAEAIMPIAPRAALTPIVPALAPALAPAPIVAAQDPCTLTERERIARGVTCTRAPANPPVATRPPASTTPSMPTGVGLTAPVTTQPIAATTPVDPCTLSAREQIARGVTCNQPTSPTPVRLAAAPATNPAIPTPRPVGTVAETLAGMPANTRAGLPVPPPSEVSPVVTPVAIAPPQLPATVPDPGVPQPTTTAPTPIRATQPAVEPIRPVLAMAPTGTTAQLGNVVVNYPQRPGMDTLTMASGSGGMPMMPPPLIAKAIDRTVDPFHETGQLIILWDEPKDAAEGLAIVARDFAMSPVSVVVLAHLGGTVATFQFADHKQAVLTRTALQQAHPTWRVDLNARYRSLEGARIYAPSKVDAPMPISAAPTLRVGLLDSGVAMIPAMRDVRMVQRSFLASSDVPAASDHGTAIAALIGGRDTGNNFQGMALGAQIYAGAIMRQQSGEGSTNAVMLLRGLDWLVGEEVSIINLSLGGPGNDVMASGFEKLVKRRVIVVVAAGNNGPLAPPSYPAAYRGVIAVTAVDALDRPYADANRGRYITIAAPGVDVWAPDAGNGRYVTGTSFSTAFVTSAIGLMLSSRSDLTTDMVRNYLCSSARDLGDRGQDGVFGCGLLQIRRTLVALKVGPSSSTPH